MLNGSIHGLRNARARAFTAAGALMLSGLLASCSSVPDAVNPIEWYKSASDLVTGDDHDKDPAPAPSQAGFPDVNKTVAADTRKDLAKGLPADKGNAKYAEPVRREVAPTKPLVRRAPAPADTQVAQAAPAAAAPAVPPKPVVTAQELPPVPAPAAAAQTASTPAPSTPAAAPRLSPGQRTAVARDDGPAAPPAAVDMAPPAPAGIPETVPARGPRRLQEQFERRLAESAQTTVRPDMVAAGPSSSYRPREEEPIHLVPPSSQHRKGGGKGMAAPEPDLPAATFQVASVDFRSGSSELTAADRESIAEVARLYKQTGGTVRVVGSAPAPVFGGDELGQKLGGLDASMTRANAVAAELARRGVPARKILVGADPAAGRGGAQVYIDVM